MPRILIFVLACLCGGAAALAALPATAADHDLDCAVILCLAAGFPVEPSGTCAEAFEHMIDRITDTPPKPPVGVCRTSDGSEYAPAQVLFSQPSRQARSGWICPEPSPMRFSETEDYTLVAPVCYPDAEHVPSVVQSGSGYWFPGAPVAAERILYRFQITLPADGEAPSFVSPLYLSNPGAGLARALTAADIEAYGAWPDLPVEVAQ
jgi:hypothetical protein